MAKTHPNPGPDQGPQTPPDAGSKGGCLSIIVRLSWVFGGIIVLIYCAVFIAREKHPGTTDLIFWLTLAAIVLLRFVDIRFLQGETLDNKPATITHWRRYALKISAAAAVLYAVAKLIAYKNLV